MIPSRPAGAAAGVIAGALAALASSPSLAEAACAPGSTPIADGQGGAERAIRVDAPSNAVVESIEVSVAVAHPWVGDLRIVLRHPSGTEVVLLDRPGLPSAGFPGPWGCGGDDVAATFADAAALEAESMCSTTAVPVIAGAVRPLQPLAALAGLPAGGTWTLIASDVASVDGGTLGDVCLTVEMSAPCPPDIDGNGQVDGADLAEILAAWGSCAGCAADLTKDGEVDGGDLAIVLGSWGSC